jgi:hypothetical protein
MSGMREKRLPWLPRGVILAQFGVADKMSQGEFVWAGLEFRLAATGKHPILEPHN